MTYWLLPWKKLGAFVTHYWSLSPLQAWVQPAFLIAAVLLAPILLRLHWRTRPCRNLPRPKMPATTGGRRRFRACPSWMIGVLLLVFAFSPAGYVLWLLVPVTIQLALLRARAHAWRYRELSNTDSEVRGYYSLEKETRPRHWQAENLHVQFAGARFRRLFILIYRLVIVLGEPVTLFPIIVARLIRQIPRGAVGWRLARNSGQPGIERCLGRRGELCHGPRPGASRAQRHRSGNQVLSRLP
jgi:hypothetical protein